MFVKECMRTEINSVVANTSVLEADWIMNHKNLPYLLVTDHDKPIGVVMHKAIRNLITRKSDNWPVSEFIDSILIGKVENVMENVILVEPDTPIECAVIIGQEQGISVFPVMEGGKMTGVATGVDFLAHSPLTHEQDDSSKSSCVLVSCRTSALSDVFDVVNDHEAMLLSVLHFKSPIDGRQQCIVHIGADNVERITHALNKKKLHSIDLECALATP